jgi:pimeloyl-ACP methyl ester carboxylesterase
MTGSSCQIRGLSAQPHSLTSQVIDVPPQRQTFADDVAAVISVLDLQDLTMVGHSMAGGEIVR